MSYLVRSGISRTCSVDVVDVDSNAANPPVPLYVNTNRRFDLPKTKQGTEVAYTLVISQFEKKREVRYRGNTESTETTSRYILSIGGVS